MAVWEAHDRRGRSVRGRFGLLERGDALAAIDRMLDLAAAGRGSALLLEGHAGMGKTRLHEAALDAARGREMRVLRAAGAELEQAFAFGVAAQLLSAQLDQLPPAHRDALVAHSPDSIRAFTAEGARSDESDGTTQLAMSHSLFALLASPDDDRPALIAIDDLQWCDTASLEFILYVLHRLEELPLAILLTGRTERHGETLEVLDQIAAHPKVALERLPPLGLPAVRELVEEALDERAEEEVIHACSEATAGNPFYLRELLLALAEERELSSAELAQHARSLAPNGVTRIVRVRVGRLGAHAAALARAVAILDDDTPLRHAAELAELDLEAASAAADALAGDEILLAREPLRFVHPLVRHAIANDIPASERASRHLDAARLLHGEGADAERVAAHLLLGRAQGDDWVVGQLCAAARAARRRSAPESAARYLRRALEEPPAPERKPEVLADLGVAEALAGLPSAAEHLELAVGAIADPGRRAELALEHGRALVVLGRHEAAAAAYERGLRDLAQVAGEDAELRAQLQVGYVSAASLIPAMQPDVMARSKTVLENIPSVPHTQGQRVVLAQAAVQRAFNGGGRDEVIELAERAWGDGRLIEHAGVPWVGWRAAAGAFLLAGDLERSIDIAEAAAQDAQRRGWPLGLATARFMRGLPELWRGEVDRASADLEAALDARRYGWRQFARAAAAHYSLCLIEKGELDRAEQVLREAAREAVHDLEDAFVLYSLGALRLEQGRPQEALDLAISCGETVERHVHAFGYCPWRTAAAQALLVLGQQARALELAGEAAERAQHSGVLHQRIRALRVLGLCQGGREGIETLREALATGHSGPPRLETIRALVELGAALRRDNQRIASREPLQLAADLARRGGATALHDRARTELTATGARPRRDALLSGPDSLTPSERRIAELAAAGKANREIAQTLFVTSKTVEYHLRNAYRKLGIGQRKDLRDALTS